jgi:hypothetical protein
MTPTKCPNCRLSLPQNWTGANDPNAKCPYCGKPVAFVAAASAPAAPPPAAPAPKAAAKTILWGAGVPLPSRFPDRAPQAPVPAPSPRPQPAAPVPVPRPAAPAVSPPAPVAARPGLAESPTAQRNALGTAETVPPAKPPEPAPATAEPAGFDVDMSEPAPSAEPPAAQPQPRPNQPAPTVMFESAIHGTVPSEPESSVGGAPSREEQPDEESSPGPTPTRGKAKAKVMPRKGAKPRPGFATSRRAEEDDQADVPKPASSKAGLIIFLVLLLSGAAVIGVILLRGRTKSEPGPEEKAPPAKSKPLIEPVPAPSEAPAALAPKPAAPAPAALAPKPAEKPARAEKPAPIEKPVRAEKPVVPERPEVAEKVRAAPSSPAGEPPPAAGKPTEADYRNANEAYQRGNTKLFQGDTPGAIAEFNRALKLNPKDPAIHRGLGLAYAQSGKKGDAIKHLKAYLKASPKANDRALIEKRIDQLKGQ